MGAHASSVPRMANTQHAGCVRSQEHAEENPWQLAKDFGLSTVFMLVCTKVQRLSRAPGLIWKIRCRIYEIVYLGLAQK